MVENIFTLIIIFILFLFGTGGVYLFITGIREKDSFWLIIGVLLILIGFGFLLGSFYDYIKEKSLIQITESTKLVVIEKEHKNAYTQVIYNGKTTSCIYHSEENNITITDGQHKEIIDNEKVYKALNKGDKIDGYRIIYKRKNGKVYKTKLKIKMH